MSREPPTAASLTSLQKLLVKEKRGGGYPSTDTSGGSLTVESLRPSHSGHRQPTAVDPDKRLLAEGSVAAAPVRQQAVNR